MTTKTERIVSTVGKYEVKMDLPVGYQYGKDATRKTRIYVWAADIEAEIGVHPEYSIRGENADLDKAWRAYNKKEVEALKKHLVAALGEQSVRFSKTAGCSCGCSAGFIYTGEGRLSGATNIYITEKKA